MPQKGPVDGHSSAVRATLMTSLRERMRTHPVRVAEMARALVAAGGLLGWVALPAHRSEVLLGFGVAVLLVGALEVPGARRLPSGSLRHAGLVRALALGVAGPVLMGVAYNEKVYRLALAIGVMLAIRAVADLWAWRGVSEESGVRNWLLGLGLFEAATAVAALVRPDLFGQFAVAILGLVWLAGAFVVLLAPTPPAIREVTIAPYLRRARLTDEGRSRIEAEIPDVDRTRLGRFLVLLSAAAIIATFGVLADSVASIIGAMIMAPLMEPIIGLSAGLVAQNGRRIASHAALLLTGIAVVYLISTLVGASALDLAGDLNNPSIVARTSPTLSDLVVALAAGAVGSFALVRRDVSPSLPGVAVAVSLVPPLCVSGVNLAGGEQTAAWGAFLLFLVNFAAITAASGAVLILAGYGSEHADRGRFLMTGAVIAVAIALLAIPLATTGKDLVNDRLVEAATRSAFVDWSEPVAPARILDIQVDHDKVSLLVVSAQTPPSSASLRRAIEADVGRSVRLDVRWIAASPL